MSPALVLAKQGCDEDTSTRLTLDQTIELAEKTLQSLGGDKKMARDIARLTVESPLATVMVATIVAKDKHEAFVSLALFDKVQERLGLKAKTKARVDINQDFPLRGFALCECCGGLLTASWSTGRAKKHAYYRCKAPKAKCRLSGKSIHRDKMDGDFEALLRSLRPSEAVLERFTDG